MSNQKVYRKTLNKIFLRLGSEAYGSVWSGCEIETLVRSNTPTGSNKIKTDDPLAYERAKDIKDQMIQMLHNGIFSFEISDDGENYYDLPLDVKIDTLYIPESYLITKDDLWHLCQVKYTNSKDFSFKKSNAGSKIIFKQEEYEPIIIQVIKKLSENNGSFTRIKILNELEDECKKLGINCPKKTAFTDNFGHIVDRELNKI